MLSANQWAIICENVKGDDEGHGVHFKYIKWTLPTQPQPGTILGGSGSHFELSHPPPQIIFTISQKEDERKNSQRFVSRLQTHFPPDGGVRDKLRTFFTALRSVKYFPWRKEKKLQNAASHDERRKKLLRRFPFSWIFCAIKAIPSAWLFTRHSVNFMKLSSIKF